LLPDGRRGASSSSHFGAGISDNESRALIFTEPELYESRNAGRHETGNYENVDLSLPFFISREPRIGHRQRRKPE